MEEPINLLIVGPFSCGAKLEGCEGKLNHVLRFGWEQYRIVAHDGVEKVAWVCPACQAQCTPAEAEEK